MIDDELKADKIEEILRHMFAQFRSSTPGLTEYSICYNPRMSATWFIVVFFKDIKQLKQGLEDGVCYHIHRFIQEGLGNSIDLNKVTHFISFEYGPRPMDKKDIHVLFDRLVKRELSLMKQTGKESSKECAYCGHDFDKHNLMGNIDKNKSAPTKGWIVCPDEGCTCFQTWDANYNGAGK